MKTIPLLRSLLNLSCSLLAMPWAASPAQETPAPHPSAVEVIDPLESVDGSELPENVAAKRGEAVDRRNVGGLGFISKLVLEGNTVISAKALRRALATDLEVVLASHPAANLADFLPVIADQLVRGYHNCGFPEAKVAAGFDATLEGGRIVVRIDEGPRYRMGKIQIASEGGVALNSEKLIEKLLEKTDVPSAGTLADILRGSMGAYGHLLPQPETKAEEDLPEAPKQQVPAASSGIAGSDPAPAAPENPATNFLGDCAAKKPSASSSFAASTVAPWTPGSPVVFPDADSEPLLEVVQFHLATLGRPLARLHTAYALRADGAADLVIRIEDLGPLAVTGRIQVIGGAIHTAEEIAAAAGLKRGQPFVPELLDTAVVALWNTGRFFPFTITPQPADNDPREIDITIQVHEIEGVPPLSAMLPPEQETARRFFSTLNEWAATGRFTDFIISTKEGREPALIFGFSGRDGLILGGGSRKDDVHATASISRSEVRCRLTHQGQNAFIRLPVPTDRLRVQASILPNGRDRNKFTIGFGCGFSSRSTPDERFTFRLALSPAIALLKPESIRREGDQWVLLMDDEADQEMLRLDLSTALPVSGNTTQVEFRDGAVREQQQALADEMAKLGDSQGVQCWLEAARTILRLLAENGKGGERGKQEFEQWHRWLRFASTLMKPELSRPFTELWAKWSADSPDAASFSIPVDPALLQQFGMMNLWVGLGTVAASEMLAPPDSWLSKLSREMVFFQGGKTQYTARTIQELLADPTMGPIGCWLAAQLWANYDAAAAEGFLHKALAQASAEGFRQDWQLVLDSPMGLGQAAAEVLAALAAIRAEDEQKLAAQLEPALAAWFTGFLTHLREMPAAAGLAGWIAPQMDVLWNNILSENFRKDLDQRLHPALDATEFVAVVNGQPIPRAWLRFIGHSYPGIIAQSLPSIAPDPARLWTQDPALAAAIRLALLAPLARDSDQAKLDELIAKVTESCTTHLAGDTDADWIATFGMTRRELGLLAIRLRQIGTVKAQLPKPDEPTLAKWWQERAAQFGRQGHFHTFRTTVADTTAESAALAADLVTEAAALVHDGLPFSALAMAARHDEGSGITVECAKDLLPLDLKPECLENVAKLRPEEVSPVVELGNTRWVAMLVDWNTTPPPALDTVRAQVIDLWKNAEYRIFLERRLRQLEEMASIHLIDDPAATPSDQSVFAGMLEKSPASPVARLGVFWRLAQANDPRATAALDKVLEGPSLGSAALNALAAALSACGQCELAARCKARSP